MFKFNFNNDEEFSQPRAYAEDTNRWYECKEVEIPSHVVDLVNTIPRDQIIKVDYNCGVTFSCLSAKEVMNMLKEKSGNEEFLDVLKADKVHSDLLPGKYEGGLKTWECTKDLAVYFMRNKVCEIKNELHGKTVLDLGCGSGLLGIMCLSLGATVTFQDYNQEVLEAMTIPNIFLNCDASVRERTKLFSGDWSSFLQLMERKNDHQNKETPKFDYILTSETIYNPENYNKLITIFKRLLKPSGSAFVAAKSHYFGVGGNLNEFETLLQQEGLNSNMCWGTNEGVSRGILEVTLLSRRPENDHKWLEDFPIVDNPGEIVMVDRPFKNFTKRFENL